MTLIAAVPASATATRDALPAVARKLRLDRGQAPIGAIQKEGCMNKTLSALAFALFLPGIASAADRLSDVQMAQITAGALPSVICPACATASSISTSMNGITETMSATGTTSGATTTTGGNSSTGGNSTGGNSTGGNSTGGNSTGGNTTGGNTTGGNTTGGNTTGNNTTGGTTNAILSIVPPLISSSLSALASVTPSLQY